MSLNKLVIASLAGVSLLGGLVVTSTPAMAKSKTFKYYENESGVKHYKHYKSMNKYTLNKKFTVRYSGKVKINHIYVFHVSPMRSKYQTWVKVTGSLDNRSTGQISLGQSKYFTDDQAYYYIKNSEVSLATSTPLQSSRALSYGPIGTPYYSGGIDEINSRLEAHTREKFDLILHSKEATSKLGPATLKFRTSYEGSNSDKVTNTTKTIKLNLN